MWVFKFNEMEILNNKEFVCWILSEIEPSEETKKLMKETLKDIENADEIIKNYRYEIKFNFKSKKLVCTCLGFKSASKVGRVCHHLYEFLTKNGMANDITRRICPKKWQRIYLDKDTS